MKRHSNVDPGSGKLVFNWTENGERRAREFDPYVMQSYTGDPGDSEARRHHSNRENANRREYVESCRAQCRAPVPKERVTVAAAPKPKSLQWTRKEPKPHPAKPPDPQE